MGCKGQTLSMTESHLRDGILGSLVTAGLGDALGAATEQWTTAEIYAKHGGPLREILDPPIDTFAGTAGNTKGQVTDDASQMYYLAEDIIAANGRLDEEVWRSCLLRWASESPHIANMGPSTRPIVEALQNGQDPYKVGLIGKSDRYYASMGATNGSSMRVAPAGLIHPGDIEGACQAAASTCFPTHCTNAGISAACAIASGCAEALTDAADTYSVVQAALAGARRGEELTVAHPHGRMVPGPSIAERISLAVQLALEAEDLESMLHKTEALIGNSVMACESVPAAVGLFVFSQGDPWETIVGGTNLGNDTDSIAAIGGSLAGALRGFKAVPADNYALFRSANLEEHDVEIIADGLVKIAMRNLNA